MKLKNLSLSLALAVVSVGVALGAKADTVPAHCDLYAPREDYPSLSSVCTFSQRQGYITINLQSNGVSYELSPVPNAAPGNFRDQHGKAVYRQSGLGSAGTIFEFVDGSHLWVYWDESTFSTTPATQGIGSDPVTQGIGGSSARIGTLVAHSRGSQINLRSQPTVRSRALGYGLAGDQVQIYLCQPDTDTPGSDLNWCNVQFVVSGANGWIRSDFIIFPSDGF
ncbi:MAG TPA: SH3 domain-containing protein [Leptolyngbyaceae cyanobacterium M65_K2018_010]|nr:SH3 domain-containing protein [Leptolyngbyaceae cyanobacterium M65_K2018_010]